MDTYIDKTNVRSLIPLNEILDNPYQPRFYYDEDEINSLALSIQEYGLLQIPIGRRTPLGIQLAFGHRRKRAFENLFNNGDNTCQYMPVMLMDLSDKQMFEFSITENIKRKDLNPIEKAKALKQYMDQFGASSTQAAALFGIPASTIRGTIRLLNLSPKKQTEIAEGKLSQTQARLLLKTVRGRDQDSELTTDKYVFDLRDALSFLIYGEVRNVSDEQLFQKVKEVFAENKRLLKETRQIKSRFTN